MMVQMHSKIQVTYAVASKKRTLTFLSPLVQNAFLFCLTIENIYDTTSALRYPPELRHRITIIIERIGYKTVCISI
jgi:hypothetical protein